MRSSFYTKIYPGIVLAGIFLWGVVIYRHALHAPFQFDDLLLIVENNLIKSFNNITWLWNYDPSRFLTHLTFALNYHWGGGQVFGYHLVNVILHALVTVVFYFLLQLIFAKLDKHGFSDAQRRWITTTAVFIFLSHPLQTQAVTYVAQRSTLLASLCYLGSLWLYLRFRMENDRRYYWGALGAALLGLFTKPIIVTLPFALLLCEIFFFDFFKKGLKRVLAGLAPFLVLVAMVPLFIMMWKLRVFDISRYFEMTQETAHISRWEYLITQFNVGMTYLRLLLFPVNQNLDYDYPIASSFWTFPTWLSFCVLAGIFFFALKMFSRQKLISFGLLWMFLTLSLESSIFPITDVINEHRLYLPMVGFSILLPVGLVQLLRKPRMFGTVLCGLVLLYGGLTYQRNYVWKDRIGFLKDIAQKSPNKPRVHNNLGIAYAAEKQFAAAEEEYKKAIQLKPDFTHPRSNLANIYMEQGRLAEAIEQLQAALAADPGYAVAYYNLGNVYWLQQDWDLAKENYQKAVDLKPSFVLAIVALGKSFRRKGDLERAELYFYSALRINPDDEGAYANLGDLYLVRGQYEKAIENYNQAIRCDPSRVTIYNSLGNVYDMLGQLDWAERIYKEAMWRDQSFAHTYFNLGNTLRKKGQLEEAKLVFTKAAELYAQQGNRQMAAACRQRLERLFP